MLKGIMPGLLAMSIIFSSGTVMASEQTSQGMSHANNAQPPSTLFALRLFNQVASNKSDTGNVLISPFSAYAALSMALSGSAGSTRQQMAEVLGITSDQVDALNARNKGCLDLMNSNQNVQLDIANAIYSDRAKPFKPEFIALCKNIYGAEAHNVDFSSRAVLDGINAWCSSKTHGKIPKIIGSLGPDESMVLLNAIYFKGNWQKQFNKAATRPDNFTTLAGNLSPISMMHQRQSIPYFRGSGFQAVSIPYVGGRQSIYIFLPEKGVDFGVFLSQFQWNDWNQWMLSFRTADVNLSMPKFRLQYDSNLSNELKAIGMQEAFEKGRANFSKMIGSPYKAWISRVLQKTYMDVNEEGTEAAAATAVIMSASKAILVRSQPIEFRVDHPFVLALVDNSTNEVLFLGKVVNPEAPSNDGH